MSEVNWDAVIAEREQVVPSGWQDVTVVKTEATTASTGSPMIKLAVEIQGGPYDSRWVWTNLVFKTESATNMRIVMKSLAAFGISDEYLSTNKPTMAQLADALMGRQAQASISVRKWNEEDINDVSAFRALGAGTGVAGEAPPPPPLPADMPTPVVEESPFRGKGDPSEPF